MSYIANQSHQQRLDFGQDTVELTSLAVMTRDSLRNDVVPCLSRALAMTGNPMSKTRSDELAALLKRVRTTCQQLCALYVHAIGSAAG